jgi:hypothetical protein
MRTPTLRSPDTRVHVQARTRRPGHDGPGYPALAGPVGTCSRQVAAGRTAGHGRSLQVGENTATEGENTATEGENTATEGENTATEGENTATEGVVITPVLGQLVYVRTDLSYPCECAI